MSGFTYRIQGLLAAGLLFSGAVSLKREEGQTFVEYAVVLGVVVVTMAAALTFLRDSIGGLYTQIVNDFDAAL